MKTVVLDLDDFSVLRNGLDYLLRIKDHYPDFKVSLFTIPFDYEFEISQFRIYREKELKKIHENLDWMQIIPHGLTHVPREFENCDKHTMKMILDNYEKEFSKDGLPYEKGFKAPYWLWNQEVVDVLDQKGWWGAVDRNQPKMLSTKRFYKYSHSLDEPFWLSDREVIKLHGHITPPSANNLADCILNIFKLPSDTKFKFVTEFIEQKE